MWRVCRVCVYVSIRKEFLDKQLLLLPPAKKASINIYQIYMYVTCMGMERPEGANISINMKNVRHKCIVTCGFHAKACESFSKFYFSCARMLLFLMFRQSCFCYLSSLWFFCTQSSFRWKRCRVRFRF